MSAATTPELERVRILIGRSRQQPLSRAELSTRSVELAAALYEAAEREKTALDRERANLLSRMMMDRRGQVFTTTLTDRAHRSTSARTTVSQAVHLVSSLGAPSYLGPFQRFQLGLLRVAGRLAPELARSKMLERIKRETASYILSAEPDALNDYLQRRAEQGVRINVNHLGEEVLGEAEAERRVRDYQTLLRHPRVDTISVKISSIFSQLDTIAFEHSVATIRDRLRPIYETALSESSGSQPKLVYLDMEAYRDLEITLRAFRDLLDEERFAQLSAGCVLQAYLPDSAAHQRSLLQWARARVARGGRPIRVRIVKGANLAMERLESDERGWELPIYASKGEVDANFKRMVRLGAEPENARAAHLGIATHNLFDLSFGLLVSASLGTEKFVGFELLEGMADPLRRTLQHLGTDLLLYAPVVEEKEFPSAIAYLVRRLDENTAKENFLRHSFGMQLNDEAWKSQRAAFEVALQRSDDDSPEQVSIEPHRQATLALKARMDGVLTPPLLGPFINEPDTEFSLSDNRAALKSALDRVKDAQPLITSSLADPSGALQVADGFDPSRPEHVPYRMELLTEQGVRAALRIAEDAKRPWKDTDLETRVHLLRRCAEALRRNRAELIALMLSDAGKRPDEADTEISEAVDFAEYYARSALELGEHLDDSGVKLVPRGLVLVTPPWNFPLAIPLGGVFASLAMGNVVILKPALETPRVAHRAVELCWEAGVDKNVLQLVLCEDQVGSHLVQAEQVNAIVLTGASSTARLFQRMRPRLPLFAETGGKNAMIVMPMADRELAIQDIVRSAFGHAGQKCSALSQLILHRELYDDEAFLGTLRDAAASMKVGSAWELESRVTPMISPPSDVQRRALQELEEGESWLLQPRFDEENPRLVSPGIKMGVKPGSFAHTTEFFCPLISVLCAEDLSHAIDIANATPYGLTSGLHSLDERDQAIWSERIASGNLYVNRRITGAIVQRQPFGGMKQSSFGPGAKAGGPNYTSQLALPRVPERPCDVEHALPKHLTRLLQRWQRAIRPHAGTSGTLLEEMARVLRLYQRDFERHFAHAHDARPIPGQDNLLRYLPAKLGVCVLSSAAPGESDASLLRDVSFAMAAHWVSGSDSCILAPSGAAVPPWLQAVATAAEVPLWTTDVEAFLSTVHPERVLLLGAEPSMQQRELFTAHHVFLTTRSPVPSGRIELLLHLKEQALSITYHRYGHLGLHELQDEEPRAA